MAVTTTSRLGVTRWSAGGDLFTRAQMDTSHANMESRVPVYLHGTIGARPAAGTVARFYYATDTQHLYYDDGVAWRDILGPSVVTLTGSQTLTNKSLTAPTITGTIALPATTSIGNVSDTEISYLDGVTSALQTQLGSKAPLASPTFTGTVSLPSATSIGNVSNTEIGYLDGVTGALQTQLDNKAPLASPTFTGTVVLPSATSIGSVSNTEIGYLDGVTSALQTQLDNKAPLASPTFTGTVSLGNATSSGDIETTTAGTKGLILKSANSTRYRVTVENDGSLTTTAL